jgi:hypothetical protein
MANFHLSSFAESEKDATKALSLDARYTKAFVRRGLAREAQGKFELALQDFEAADLLEPGVPLVLDKLRSIRPALGISADGRIREVKEPKVEIIEEAEPLAIEVAPRQDVDRPPGRPGSKIEVVSEVSFAPKRSPEVEVADDMQPSRKVAIIAEDRAPRKARIVDVSEPVPLIEVVEDSPQPRKVVTVDESQPAAEVASRRAPIKVTIVDDSESPRPTPGDDVPSEKLAANAGQSKAPARAARSEPLTKAAKSQRSRMTINWVDLPPDQYVTTLAQITPKELNESLGRDIPPHIVVRMLAAFTRMDDRVLAFEFLEELSANRLVALEDEHRLLAHPSIVEVLDTGGVNPERKIAIRRSWKLD